MPRAEAGEAAQAERASPTTSHCITRTAHRSLARPHSSTLPVAQDHDYRNASTGSSTAAAAAYSHPVELQVETMSSISTRVFLYSWYAVLAIALVAESTVTLQWVCRNFCGDATVSAYHLEDWNSSSCLSWEAYWILPEHDRRMRTGGASASCAPSSISLLLGGGGAAAGSAEECPYAWVAWPPMEAVAGESGEDRADLYRTRTRTAMPALGSLSSSISSHEEEADNTTTTTTTFTPSPRPTMAPLRRVYQLRWTADTLSGVVGRELNRFLHVYLSLASPLAQGFDTERAGDHHRGFGRAAAPPPPPSWKVFEVLVALEETSSVSLSAEDDEERRNALASDVLSASSSETSSSSSGSGGNRSRYVYTYKASVTCYRTARRCNNLVLPASVVIPFNRSRLTVTLIDVEAELAEATVRATKAASCAAREHVDAPHLFSAASMRGVLRSFTEAAPPAPSPTSTLTTGVGVMHQRGRFTLGTMLLRYASLLVTVVSALRFLYRSRSAPRMIFEQKWTLGLQLGLLLYLNPLCWWCIHAGAAAHDAQNGDNNSSFSSTLASRQPIATSRSLWYFTLYFVEFHIPTYFVTLVVCYIWSVVGGSFRWSAASASTASTAPQSQPPQAAEEPQPATPSAAAAAGPASAPSAHMDVALPDPANSDASVGVTVPATVTVSGSHLARRRVRVFLAMFTATVSLLDTAKLLCEDGGPLGDWGDVACRTPRCLLLQRSILYVILGGILSSGVGLYWLRRNLARHPYLSTRPQQLACRIMIFIYFTGGLYCLLQALLLETLYAPLMAIIYYQPLVQLSHLLVLTSFVIHMTYVYTTTQASLQIPLRPSDPRWKTVGWSTRWYRWLEWHGGSLYVFFNEAEERRFYEVQVEHELAKRERIGRRAALRAQRKAEKKGKLQQQQHQQRGMCAGEPPQLPDGDAENAAAGGGSRAASAYPRGRTLPNVRRERGRYGALRDDVATANLSASLRQAANVRSTATAPTTANFPPPPLSRPPTFAMYTDTLSALSEPEETDWLLPPDDDAVGIAERQDRHPYRTLSTVTQASSNTSEGGDGGLHDFQHTAGASVQTSSHTPAAASPFPPAAMPTAVPSDTTVGDVDGALVNSRRQRTPTRVLSRVSSRVLMALQGAESRLVEGTATFVDLLAEKCVDLPLQVLLRQRARQRYVFFNLETAIDCLNLSREAYAVQESKGDNLIRTGIHVDAGQVPRAAVTFVERVVAAIFGLCFKNPPLEPDTVGPAADDDNAEDGYVSGEATVVAVDDAAGLVASTPPAAKGEKLDAQPQPNKVTTPPTSPSRSSRTEAKEGGKGWRRVLAKVNLGDDDGGEGAAAAAADSASPAAPAVVGTQVESPSTPPRPTQPQPPPSSSSPSISPTALASPSSPPPQLLLPHMNVEQYGYSPVAVFDTRGVQVLVARMDISGDCPVHAGKVPRLTIAFRGTNSVANVLEDIRFQKRTWKEMETPTLLPRASVHSGFLELWMSLKEAVMDVVLRELRGSQNPEEEENVTAAVNGGGDGNSATSTAVPHDAVPASNAFHTTEAFTSHWSAPAHQGTQAGRRSGFLRVYVTGHSLGGALACLCAYSLRRMLLLLAYPEPDVVVYTFGQPRIGNSVFKQHYNRAVPCTFRVVNESDAVSGFNILGGHHVGVQVNVDRHGNYVCKPMYIERLLRPTRGRGLALLNHKLVAYASSLNAVADVYAHGACPVRCLEPYLDAINSASGTESGGEDCGGMSVQAVRLPQREEVEAAKKLERYTQ